MCMVWLRTEKVIHEVEEKSKLYFLLSSLIGAYNRRTDVLAKGASTDNSQVLTAISNLSRKVDTMSSNIDRIEKEAADAAENVGLVRTAIEELKAASEAMQTEIASLKDQVAKGQLDQARLDAAAAAFEKADDDIDAIVLPGAPPAEPPA
jgi:chromosome segregation ATPase